MSGTRQDRPHSRSGPSPIPALRSCATSTMRSPQRKKSRRAPHAGSRAVEPQAEPQASGVEGDGALRVWRADHHMVEARDRARPPRPRAPTAKSRGASAPVRGDDGDRDPMRRRRARCCNAGDLSRVSACVTGRARCCSSRWALSMSPTAKARADRPSRAALAWAAHVETHIGKLERAPSAWRPSSSR